MTTGRIEGGVSFFMFNLPMFLNFLSVLFGILAGVFGLLALYSVIRTDRKIPYVQASKSSIKKGFLFLALTYLSLIVMAGFINPDGLETLAFCLPGGLLVLVASYGIAYRQVEFLVKEETSTKENNLPEDRIDKK